jgi:rod shape-determining protein MreD
MQRESTTMPPAPALALPSWWRAFGALAAALIAQATLLAGLHVRGGSISLALLVVLWYAVRAGTARGAFFGLVAGACEDAVAGGTGIAWTVATPLAAMLAARVVRGLRSDNPLFLAGVAGACAFVRILAFWLMLRAQHLMPVLDAPALHAALWSAVSDGTLALAVLLAFKNLRPLHVGDR